MKIAIIGHGKMGHEVEKMAIRRGHTISLIIDGTNDWDLFAEHLNEADLAIEFSSSGTVVENIYRCFMSGIPVISGTTGWSDSLGQVRTYCLEHNQTLFIAPNFSIGVNLFFELNRQLAGIMASWSGYEISIEETHHVNKKDAPSGTAIVLANDIIRHSQRKDKWVREIVENPEELGIKSYRTENVPGTHVVRYESEDDSIEIVHTAKSRRGFALGAVMAAEWLMGKKGFFEMQDFLADFNIGRSG